MPFTDQPCHVLGKAGSLFLPLPLLLPILALYPCPLPRSPAWMDGSVTGKFVSRRRDAAKGWWSGGAPSNARAPFDQPFALSLSLAVGDPWSGAPLPNTTFPATLAVDFVRVYGFPA